MIPDHKIWTDYHIRELQGFRVGVEKVVPTFEDIAEDVERAVNEHLGPMSAYDGGTAAWERSFTICETMFGVRQGVLNLLAVGLHHLFEQQQLFFLRKGLSFRGEKLELKDGLKIFKTRLRECGVEWESLSCAKKLCELRLAANAIKHAAGPSAVKLAKRRPDLFTEDDAKTPVVWAQFQARRRLYTPLAGDSLYVSERDLSEWCDAAIAFWEELSAWSA